MPPLHDVSQAVEFATLLWGPRMPSGLFLQVWAKRGAKSRSTYLEHWAGLDGVLASQRHADVYVGCSAVAKRLGATVRGKAKDAAAICGLWADLDVGPGYAPDTADAIEVAHAVATPTCLVGSGGGVHAWWVFEEPWVFDGEDDRQEAALVAEAWVETLRGHAAFKLDSVGELARVLRMPGSYNQKQEPERPVELLTREGVTYPRQTLIELAAPRRRRLAASKADAQDGALGDLPTEDDVPWAAIRAMREADTGFDRTWTRKRQGAAATWTDSEYDLSIVGTLLATGMDEHTAVACAAAARREYGNPEKAAKADRLDYWQRTVRKARTESATERAAAEAKAEEDALVVDLRDLRDAPAVAVEATMPDRWAKLNQLVGGGQGGSPRVIEWHQYGTDPNEAKHVWVLTDGVEVPIGTMFKVLDQRSVKVALASVSSIFRPGQWKAATWELGIQTVLPLRTFHAAPDDERDVRALEWVSQIIAGRSLETDPDHLNHAMQMRLPFLRDGRIYVGQKYLGQQLRFHKIAPDLRDGDLPPLLRAAGFERADLNFDKPSGARGSRSYWSVDERLLP